MKNYLKRILAICLALSLNLSLCACNKYSNTVLDGDERYIIMDEDEDLDRASSYNDRIDSVCESMIDELEEDAIYYVASEIVKKELTYLSGVKSSLTDDVLEEMISRNADKLDEVYGEFNSSEFSGREKIFAIYSNSEHDDANKYDSDYFHFVQPLRNLVYLTASKFHYKEIDVYESILYDHISDAFSLEVLDTDNGDGYKSNNVYYNENKVAKEIIAEYEEMNEEE